MEDEKREDVEAVMHAVLDACIEQHQPDDVVMFGLIVTLTDVLAAMVVDGQLDSNGVEEIVRRGLIEYVDVKVEKMREQPH